MMKVLQAGLALAVCAVALPVAADRDHAAGEMVAPPADVTTRAKMLERDEEQGLRTMSREEVLERFRSAHPEGLRLAFYYNQRFSNRISDWVASERFVIGAAGSSSKQAPEGDTREQGQGNVAMQAERRRAPAAGGPSPATELQGAYVSAMRNVGVRLVERGTMMRLTDASLEDGTFTRGAPDHQRLEVQALGEHADVLVEIRALDVPSTEKPRFEMRLMDVRDGSLLAVLDTAGVPPEEEYPYQWVATDSGFERDRPPLTLSQVGTELALITMQQLVAAGD